MHLERPNRAECSVQCSPYVLILAPSPLLPSESRRDNTSVGRVKHINHANGTVSIGYLLRFVRQIHSSLGLPSLAIFGCSNRRVS